LSMLYAVGLTGGISSGKSLAASLLEPYFQLVDADLLVHELYESHQGLQQSIQDRFGDHCVVDGVVQRKELRKIVFDDPALLKELNGIVHPIVGAELHSRIQNARKSQRSTLFAIPLLFENAWQEHLDCTLLIACDMQTQIERVMKRDGSSELEARNIIQSQMSLEKKKELADFCVDNSSSVQLFQEKLIEWYSSLSSLPSSGS